MAQMRRVPGCAAALLLAASLAACGGDSTRSASPTQAPSASTADESDRGVEFGVKQAWSTYVEAALAKDGGLAADQLSQETQSLYGGFRDDALTLPAEALAGRTATDQLSIMVIRAKIEPAELRTLSDRDVLAKVFELGLIDETTYTNVNIVEVSGSGPTAVADIVQDGNRVNDAFLFRKEGGGWKLDLDEALDRANAGFVALAEEEGYTVPELVDRLIEIEYGLTAVQDLREPLDA